MVAGSGKLEVFSAAPNRLGTHLVTNARGGVVSEQVGLPYGNMIGAESTSLNASDSKRRFTSYDRSDITRLDYAINRHYSPAQGSYALDKVGSSGRNQAEVKYLRKRQRG